MPELAMPGNLGSSWLRDHWEELRDYNNRWVAANSGGIVESDPSFRVVFERLIERQQTTGELSFAYITFDVIA